PPVNKPAGARSEVLRVQRNRRIVAHVYPDVDVRLSPEVPDERRTLQPPVVPFTVVTDVAVLVERQRTLVESALFLQARQHCVLILLAVRLDQTREHLLQTLLLVLRQLGTGQAGPFTLGTLEPNRELVLGPFLHQSQCLLLAAEDRVQLVRQFRLVPE